VAGLKNGQLDRLARDGEEVASPGERQRSVPGGLSSDVRAKARRNLVAGLKNGQLDRLARDGEEVTPAAAVAPPKQRECSSCHALRCELSATQERLAAAMVEAESERVRADAAQASAGEMAVYAQATQDEAVAARLGYRRQDQVLPAEAIASAACEMKRTLQALVRATVGEKAVLQRKLEGLCDDLCLLSQQSGVSEVTRAYSEERPSAVTRFTHASEVRSQRSSPVVAPSSFGAVRHSAVVHSPGSRLLLPSSSRVRL